MTVAECVQKAKGSFIKARRLYIKAKGWKKDEWYDHWISMADEWEAAAKEKNAGKT